MSELGFLDEGHGRSGLEMRVQTGGSIWSMCSCTCEQKLRGRKLLQISAPVPGQVSAELSRALEVPCAAWWAGGGLWVRLTVCEITHIVFVPSTWEASSHNFRFTSHQGFRK